MSFRLFGIPVAVTPFFWISAVLFGLGDPFQVGLLIALPVWIVAQTLAVLVHELGHALASRRHGAAPYITLHAMGGTTTYPEMRVGRLDRALISLAGPVAGLIFGGLVLAADAFIPHGPLPVVLEVGVRTLIWINFAWSIFNLIPVLPFDGGHILDEILGPRRERTASAISLGLAVVLAALCALSHQQWTAILFVMSAIHSYQRYTLPPGAVLVNPLTTPRPPGGPSPLRRWWLQRKLGRLQAEAGALQTPRRRAGGPDLRVIQGGAAPPKDKRYLN
jgi:Zn-dependent protease